MSKEKAIKKLFDNFDELDKNVHAELIAATYRAYEEEWRPVVGFEDSHEVSNLGNVRTIERVSSMHPQGDMQLKSKSLRAYISDGGYVRVTLWKNGKGHGKFVHRLVAKAFIDNPDKLPYINHINEVKDDNRHINLEWCTHQQNISHGTCIERSAKSRSIPIAQLDKNGKFLTAWPSAIYIERNWGYNASAITRTCKGKLPHYKGFKWAYLDSVKEQIELKLIKV